MEHVSADCQCEGKVCKACDVQKCLNAFSPDKTGLYGRQARCKPCRNTALKERYHNNLETERAHSLASYHRNKEKYAARRRKPEGRKGKRRPLSEATKAKISATNTGKKRSPETLASLSEISRARWKALTDEEKVEQIAKRSASLKARYEQYGDWVGSEGRARIGAANKVRGPHKQSEEEKAKRNASLRGKKMPPLTAETRAKISASKKGKKGRPHSEEYRAQMSKARKGRALPESVLRAARSPEVIAKRTASYKKMWAALPPEEREARSMRFVEAGRKGTKNRNTDIERFMAAQLDQAQIVYEQQRRIGRYAVDFFLPAHNQIIEVNGCFWHGCEECGYNDASHQEKRAYDAKRLAYLEAEGYSVYVFWEHEIRPYIDTIEKGHKATINIISAIEEIRDVSE